MVSLYERAHAMLNELFATGTALKNLREGMRHSSKRVIDDDEELHRSPEDFREVIDVLASLHEGSELTSTLCALLRPIIGLLKGSHPSKAQELCELLAKYGWHGEEEGQFSSALASQQKNELRQELLDFPSSKAKLTRRLLPKVPRLNQSEDEITLFDEDEPFSGRPEPKPKPRFQLFTLEEIEVLQLHGVRTEGLNKSDLKDAPLYLAPHKLRYLSESQCPALVWNIFKNRFSQVVLRHFGNFMELFAKHSLTIDKDYSPLMRYLIFPEVPFVFLGYCKSKNFGYGVTTEIAEKMMDNAEKMLSKVCGSQHRNEIFALFPFLCPGYGPDKIGDTMACLMLPELLNYTSSVIKKLPGFHQLQEYDLTSLVAVIEDASKERENDSRNFYTYLWLDPKSSPWKKFLKERWNLPVYYDSDQQRNLPLIFSPQCLLDPLPQAISDQEVLLLFRTNQALRSRVDQLVKESFYPTWSKAEVGSLGSEKLMNIVCGLDRQGYDVLVEKLAFHENTAILVPTKLEFDLLRSLLKELHDGNHITSLFTAKDRCFSTFKVGKANYVLSALTMQKEETKLPRQFTEYTLEKEFVPIELIEEDHLVQIADGDEEYKKSADEIRLEVSYVGAHSSIILLAAAESWEELTGDNLQLLSPQALFHFKGGTVPPKRDSREAHLNYEEISLVTLSREKETVKWKNWKQVQASQGIPYEVLHNPGYSLFTATRQDECKKLAGNSILQDRITKDKTGCVGFINTPLVSFALKSLASKEKRTLLCSLITNAAKNELRAKDVERGLRGALAHLILNHVDRPRNATEQLGSFLKYQLPLQSDIIATLGSGSPPSWRKVADRLAGKLSDKMHTGVLQEIRDYNTTGPAQSEAFIKKLCELGITVLDFYDALVAEGFVVIAEKLL